MTTKKEKILVLIEQGKSTKEIMRRTHGSSSYINQIRNSDEESVTPTKAKAKVKVKKYFKAEIGRVDDVKSVVFTKGDTVADLLDKADLSLGIGEEVNDEYGEAVSKTDEAKEGEYIVVSNYKNA